MSCTSPWDYEELVGSGWTYNELELTYNDAEFDGNDVYFNSLALETVWDTESAPSVAAYVYEPKVAGGYTYNLEGTIYNQGTYDNFIVYYNSLGQDTEWFYEDFIDFCRPIPFLFMDGDDYLFQNGDVFEFN